MALTISEQQLADVHAHCRSAYPDECCGAMIGNLGPHSKAVLQVVPLDNAEPDSPERRFAIDPRRLLHLERDAAARKLAIVGFYHSHPDCPARPSTTDLEWAWPVYSYMIVSVTAGEIADSRCYEFDEELAGNRFAEEPFEILHR